MGDSTEISWTNKTFNPWVGCTKVGPGCDHCYAEEWDRRYGGGIHWGLNGSPRMMSADNWRKPKRWNKQALERGKPFKVFCGSLCDWCDKRAPEGQRERLWQLIRETPMLQWQLLTKRASNIRKYLPDDWGDGYPNVWLGVTVEDRKHGLRRVDMLRDIPAVVRFLSVEPLLEDLGCINLNGIDWVIVGGESGTRARPMNKQWAEEIYLHCVFQNVPYFFKQHGGKKTKGGCMLFGQEIKEWPVPR